MPARHDDEEDADDLGERDDPDESDMDESDEPEMIRCPHCRKYVNEEADQCHHCGQYIAEARGVPLWAIVTALVLLILGGLSLYYFGILI
jgi:hypothetical protein